MNARVSLTSMLAITAALPQMAFAQQAEPAEADSTLSEIVVTAQRKAENLQDVPVAVSAFSADTLERTGTNDIGSLTRIAPSVSVYDALGAPRPRIRGIGTGVTGAGMESPIAIYVDNVYYAASGEASSSFNNIARIEVLKGPQGTLFGRNATGGLVNVITKDPQHDLQGSVRLGYANYDTLSGNAYVTGGLGEDAAIDLAVTGTRQKDGYGTNFATGRDTYDTDHRVGIRSKLLLTPGENTEIRIAADYNSVDTTMPALRAFSDTLPVFGPPPPGDVWDINNDYDGYVRLKAGGAALTINHDFGAVRLLSITAYRESKREFGFDFDLTPTNAAVVDVTEKERQFTQELQLQGGQKDRFNWIVGAFFFDGKADVAPSKLTLGPVLQPAFGGLGAIATTGYQKTKSYAVFGQATAPLGQATNLTLGARYTKDDRSRYTDETGYLPGGISIGSILPPAFATDSASFGKITWRVALDHKVSDDVMAYVSVNRGFKSGGFNVTTPTEPAYKPEVLDAYEVGLKSELFGKRLRFNPSLFYYKYSNVQLPKVLPSGVQGVVNGAKAEVYGLDLDFEAIITDELVVTGGISALHDRFTDYPNADIATPVGVGNLFTVGSAKGNRLPFTSDFSSALGFAYTRELGSGKLVLAGDWNHNDGYFTGVDNLRRQPAFDTFGASLSFEADAGYSIRLWGENLSNERILSLNNVAPLATSSTYRAPRTYGVTFGFDF